MPAIERQLVMQHGTIDEIRAFELATKAARERGLPWRPVYWINLDKGVWEVRAASEDVIQVDAASGDVLALVSTLDPVQALSIAREFASASSLSWKPAFSLALERTHWIVGSSQSQLGGQVSIHVSHEGRVVDHAVNPK